MIVAWRIVKRQHAAAAMDGEGAVLFPGRWHHAGTAIVYAADSLALAALETFVHLGTIDLPAALVSIRIEIPDAVAADFPTARLGAGWRSNPPPITTRNIGTDWVASQSSAVLRVPSVLIPVETNLLINPNHKDFARLKTFQHVPFQFDPRMWK